MADYCLSVHPWCDGIEEESYKEKQGYPGKHFLYALFGIIGRLFAGSGQRILHARRNQHKHSYECGNESRVFDKSFEYEHDASESGFYRTFVGPAIRPVSGRRSGSAIHSGNLFRHSNGRSSFRHDNRLPKTETCCQHDYGSAKTRYFSCNITMD